MYIAIDVGGTNIGIGLFESENPDSLIHDISFNTQDDFEQDINRIVNEVKSHLHGNQNNGLVIGIGLPGLVDKDNKILLRSTNLPGWQGYSIDTKLEELLGLSNFKLFISTDVEAAARAEAEFTNLNEDFNFIVWGTGISAVKVYYPNPRLSTEKLSKKYQRVSLGYHTIMPTIEINGETYRGYLENFCGGAKIKEIYGKEPTQLSDKEWSEVMDYFAEGLANLMILNYSPVFVFSGGIAYGVKERLGELRGLVRSKNDLVETPEFRISQLGEKSGILGALATAI
jgi:predicted NBD/HSP70 family sugar kinase